MQAFFCGLVWHGSDFLSFLQVAGDVGRVSEDKQAESEEEEESGAPNSTGKSGERSRFCVCVCVHAVAPILLHAVFLIDVLKVAVTSRGKGG